MAASLEFGSVYKFAASVGVALCGGAVVVAWAAVQENHVLEITKRDLSRLPPGPRSTMQMQQSLLHFFESWWWVASGFLFAAGVAFLLWSLGKWSTRQDVTDETEDEQLKEIRSRTRAANSGERKAELQRDIETVVADVQEQDVDNAVSSPAPPNRSGIAAEYAEVEAQVARIVFAAYGNDYAVQRNVAIVSSPRVPVKQADLIAAPLNTSEPALIFEIKFTAARLSRRRIEDAAVQVSLFAASYESVNGVPARGVVIYVVRDNATDLSADAYSAIKQPSVGAVRLVVLTQSHLGAISSADFRAQVDGI